MVFILCDRTEGIRQSLRLLLSQKPPPFAQGRLAQSKSLPLEGKVPRNEADEEDTLKASAFADRTNAMRLFPPNTSSVTYRRSTPLRFVTEVDRALPARTMLPLKGKPLFCKCALIHHLVAVIPAFVGTCAFLSGNSTRRGTATFYLKWFGLSCQQNTFMLISLCTLNRSQRGGNPMKRIFK